MLLGRRWLSCCLPMLNIESTPIDERRFGRWAMGFAPATVARSELYLQFGAEPRFNPFALTARAALALLQAMATSA